MSCKYPHLFSPIQIGNRILKNRMISSPSGMHFNRASEPFPTDTLKAYYEMKARNGAAMMTVNGMSMYYKPDPTGKVSDFDILDGHNRQALADLVDGIHLYSSLATVNMHLQLPDGYDVSGGVPNQWLSPHGMEWGTRQDLKTAPADMLIEYAERYTDLIATMAQDCGFDGAFLHMAYRMMPLGRFLSPLTNKRTDEFGGSLENNMRYPLLVADLIKQKCGKDFLIEATISGCDPEGEGGLTTDDVAEYVKMAKGHFDLLQIKAPLLDPAHPIQFSPRTPWLDLVSEVREKSGHAVPIAAVGGFTLPADGERALADDRADVIAMARSWISNPDWVKLAYEGREDDIVPCLRCNKCHRTSEADPLLPGCSVNPLYGFDQKAHRITKTPERVKKLAVVGGGPAGMRTAMYLSDRGHRVTLYEKEAVLGGLLECTKDVSFKWTLQDYKKYLIHQVNKRNIDVKMNTAATKELLAAGQYDEVFICVGSSPTIPPIPGAKGEHVMTAIDAYAQYDKLGDQVVIVGGGEIGMETAIFLAQMGKDVTVLEMRRLLAMDSTPIHYYSMFREEWEKYANIHGIVNAVVQEIGDTSVTYRDADGNTHTVPASGVVLAAGMHANRDEALSLFVPGVKCTLVGDCNKVGNLQKLNRNAYGATSAT